jgi:hypothetical protein
MCVSINRESMQWFPHWLAFSITMLCSANFCLLQFYARMDINFVGLKRVYFLVS